MLVLTPLFMTMLAERLKKETQEAHLETEKLIIPKIKKTRTIEDYSKLLDIFYGYFKPLEDRIALFINPHLLPDFEERRKAQAIVKDKEHLGVNTNVNVSADLPMVANLNQALGVMYVLEGSTLGGVHISGMIKKNLGIDNDRGLSFFSGYGNETMEKWESFKQLLNNHPQQKEDEEEVIATANNTFLQFKEWILKH